MRRGEGSLPEGWTETLVSVPQQGRLPFCSSPSPSSPPRSQMLSLHHLPHWAALDSGVCGQV